MNIANAGSLFERLNFMEAPKIRITPPGPKAQVLLNRQKKVDSQVLTYPHMIPLAPEKGLGATVMDVDGNYYIDFSGGIGVLNVGHSLPDVVAAIKQESENVIHMLDFPGVPRVKMSEKLRAIAPEGMKDKSKVFLCGPTGSDAVEAAVKLTKFHTGKPGVISFEGGWHGVSGTGLSATGKKGVKEKFLPVMPEVYIAPYADCYRCRFGLTHPTCDLQCAKFVEHLIRDPDSGATAPGCILIEPIQGEGGIVIPPDGYLAEIRRICTEYGLLLIMDEIQTGFGRTGSMFASELWHVTPDILCVSKTLGGGLPLAAIVFKEELDTWPSGAHVGTFRGNLLACAAGLAAIEFIQEHDLALRSGRLGEGALARMQEIAATSPFVGEVRGKGLFIGIEFVKDKGTKEPAPDLLQEVVKLCFQQGLMLWKSGRWNNVGRIMPAMVITEDHLNQGIEIVAQALRAIDEKYKSH